MVVPSVVDPHRQAEGAVPTFVLKTITAPAAVIGVSVRNLPSILAESMFWAVTVTLPFTLVWMSETYFDVEPVLSQPKLFAAGAGALLPA